MFHSFFLGTCIFTLRPLYWPELPVGHFGKDRLLVKCVSITGPQYQILKGTQLLQKGLIDAHKAKSNDGIELIGITPEDILKYPDYNDVFFIVHGNVIGITTEYKDAGYDIVPLFQVEKLSVAEYLPAIFYMKIPIPLAILCIISSGIFLLYGLTRIILATYHLPIIKKNNF